MITDKSRISVCVIANPDLRVTPELLLWLLDSGVPRRNILIHRGHDRDQVAAYNSAVEMALTLKNVDYCLFADSDVRPYVATNVLWDMPHNFTCVKCDTETGLAAWADQTSFHTALWLAHRDSLAQMKSPWFGWKYNESHSQIHGCVCEGFRKAAMANGFSIGNVGHALHHIRGAKLPDSICVKTCYTK